MEISELIWKALEVPVVVKRLQVWITLRCIYAGKTVFGR